MLEVKCNRLYLCDHACAQSSIQYKSVDGVCTLQRTCAESQCLHTCDYSSEFVWLGHSVLGGDTS